MDASEDPSSQDLQFAGMANVFSTVKSSIRTDLPSNGFQRRQRAPFRWLGPRVQVTSTTSRRRRTVKREHFDHATLSRKNGYGRSSHHRPPGCPKNTTSHELVVRSVERLDRSPLSFQRRPHHNGPQTFVDLQVRSAAHD